MMPDLGRYATEVAAAYVATAILILAIVGLTIWRGARVKRALKAAEERRHG
ncbi:heme exporter protein CcmD [Palleronia sp. LCG004]|uniref:heme exporter protein CcmD n=1 Tax=Palleronia sp. LCG004 TaxID=3079304 RepID=UPI0029435B5B|nr:heme exporter protein CcmD [Palleronia sp. LCG004]WOI54849.1 heme exporter protein CcmD [Palleronia sp. LCG004]